MFGDDFRHNIAITRLKFEIYDMIARTGIVIGDSRERILTTMNSDEKQERNKILLRLKREIDELDEKLSSTEKTYLLNKIRNSKLTHGISRLKEYDPDFLNGTSQNKKKKVKVKRFVFRFIRVHRGREIRKDLRPSYQNLRHLAELRANKG